MQSDQANLLRSLAIARPEGQSTPSHRALTRSTIVIGVFVLIGLAAYWSVGRLPLFEKTEAMTAASVKPADVPVSPPPVRSAQDLVASGYVVARRKSVVGSEISGKIAAILVEEGDFVQANQPVARLDNVLAQSDLALARLRFAVSEAAGDAIAADLADAERISDRTKQLWERGYATAADQTKNETRVGVLRAQLSQSRAQLNNARRDTQRSSEMLDKYTIYAPFSGIVIDRIAEAGEIIAPAGAGGNNSFTRTGICTIVNRDSIEAEVDVTEASIGRVRLGSNVSMIPDAYPGWTIPATVAAIVPAAIREKGTVRVRIAFDNKDPRLISDMGVKIVFREE
jgi:HlyD family secretion protein